jgi:hypothetical protein
MNMPRDACGLVVMEVTRRAMAAEPGASSLHDVAGVAEDGDGHFWNACSDSADVRGRASIEQPPSPSLIQRRHWYDLTALAATASREYKSRRSTARSRQAPFAALPYENNTQEATRSSNNRIDNHTREIAVCELTRSQSRWSSPRQEISLGQNFFWPQELMNEKKSRNRPPLSVEDILVPRFYLECVANPFRYGP